MLAVLLIFALLMTIATLRVVFIDMREPYQPRHKRQENDQ